MNKPKKCFTILGLLLVVGFISLLVSHFKLQGALENFERSKTSVKEIRSWGELIYQHQQLVEAQNKDIDAVSRGEFDSKNLLKLQDKHGLKLSSSTERTIVRKTYSEKVFKLSFRNEPLKNIILFLLDAEGLGNVKVDKLTILRNPKNPDQWNCNTTIIRRIKKEATS
jgi:hypothetical protein